MAAYLVLVVGVATIVFGVGQAMFAEPAPSRRLLAAELATLTVSNSMVIAGTLIESSMLVNVGSVLLAAVLALFARSVGWRGQLGGCAHQPSVPHTP